ncbi:DHCW motif cupin fold protein [Chitinivorax sp. B]|uniref:DHCW motif cupin fold protein n=1 Tax=Chitinivorax sp. B TaxID=2502235 RepID=UPI0010F4641A|nr:DHCW motif cupin fold protein [Chitinivorax sp. B]
MQIQDVPFGITQWQEIEPTVHAGEIGGASWCTCQFGEVRGRMVTYSPGYKADHGCSKGHILLCFNGELHAEFANGRVFVLQPDMSYQVADLAEPHRSYTDVGATLFIVD